MPNIGPLEIAIIVVLALLIFGPKRLPELGSSVGKAITGFKKGLKEGEDEIRKAVTEGSSAEPVTAEKSETAETVEAKEPERSQ
ncbi:MAG: twin-arginine translocase TatA/TatE family subunit [Thermoleophilia bacterium]